jgi:hypothetical protein
LLLLAAAHQTGLISRLMQALPTAAGCARLANSQPKSRQQLLLTLLFLGAVGLDRPWDLRGYSGDGLGLLTGRRWAYGYVHTERFLSQVAQVNRDHPLTVAVASWTQQLWGNQVPYYVDIHRKPVYSDRRLPRGLIGRTGKVLGCRAVGLINDRQGHPLLAATARGDTHLTGYLPELVEAYHQAVGEQPVKQIVIDREGMGADFLDRLKDQYQVITLLKSNQYQDLTSFSDVGQFVPLTYDQHGQVVRDVAPARFALSLPEQSGQQLMLGVALIRDRRRQVPLASDAEAELHGDPLPLDEAWWEPGWVATPLPARTTAPKLIPIVSTAPIEDVVELVNAYKRRWPAQENIIRDFLLPLGLDNNHGYTKTAVENSEVAKRRATWEQQLSNVRRWRKQAFDRSRRAGDLYHRRWQRARDRSNELARSLDLELSELAHYDLPAYLINRHRQTRQGLIKAELETLWQGVHRAWDNHQREWAKGCRYVHKERKLLRQLTDLKAQERQMFELDNRKDQIMTTLRLALTNLVMWTRDQFFPKTYAQATWKRLAPFFRLPGHIVDYADRRLVYLRPFNDRQLNRDLDHLCQRVNQTQLRLPDGRYLEFLRYKSFAPILDAST